MCGVAGIFRFTPAGTTPPAIPDGALRALDAHVRWRGPDDAGMFRDQAALATGTAEVALVHRRLAVIDPTRGRQPMLGCGRAVVFNGFITNHRELRRTLEARGATFASDHSDTEVLLAADEAWGDGFVETLRGMYAFALWRRDSGTLLLARDLAGEKPLHLWEHKDGGVRTVAFASTLPALRAAARALTGAAPQAEVKSWRWLGWDDQPPFAGVRSVPPGGRVAVSAEGVAERARRVPVRTGAKQTLTPPSALAAIEASVRENLEADVPLGCLLSGGVDSSLVAALAQRALRERGATLRAFTLAMPDPSYDESPTAARTAAALGIDLTVVACPDGATTTARDDLVRLIETLGAPLGDSSLLPVAWVCAAARRHVTVALSGDGGDEAFLGYWRHWAWARLGWARGAARLVGDGLWRDARARTWRERAGRLAQVLGSRTHDEMLAVVPSGLRRELWGERVAGGNVRIGSADDLRRADFSRALPGDLLTKADHASMACALELRAPMLGVDVVDGAFATPVGVLLRGGRKGLLREAARGVVPTWVLDGPKRGFAAPVSGWLRRDWGGLRGLLEEVVLGAEALAPEVLGVRTDRDVLARLVREHDAGERDHGHVLYHLMVLGIWARWVQRSG